MTRRVNLDGPEASRVGTDSRSTTILAAMLAATLIPSLAQAQTTTKTFVGANNAAWSSASIWSPSGVPASSDNLLFDQARNTFLDVDATVNFIRFTSTGTYIAGATTSQNSTNTLTINNGFEHTNNANTSVMRIKTIVLGTAQDWTLSGSMGLLSNAASGFTLSTQSTPGPLALNTLTIGTSTLTKRGTGQLSIGNTLIGDGDIVIEEGSIRFGAAALSSGPSTSIGVSGTGKITVKPGAALMFANGGSNTGQLSITKAIRMEGTALNPSILHYAGTTNNLVGTIAAPIEWTGTSEMLSLWNGTAATTNALTFDFSGNWTGSGSITLKTTVSAGGISGTGRTLRLSGSNGGFSGLFDNRQTDPVNGVYFTSANAGSANAEWALNGTSATYELAGNNVQFGALSGTQGRLTNTSASADSIATIGGKNVDTLFAGQITQGARTLAIVKTGTGTQTFTGSSNNYTGGTTINGGTLVAGHANAFGTSGTITVESGGTLGVGDGVTFTRAFTLNAGGRVRTGDGSTVSLPSVAALAAWESQSGSGDQSIAQILYGSGSTTPTALSSAWTANPGGYFSDILTLDGTGTGNVYVLSMAYDAPSAAGLNIASRGNELGTFAPLGTSFQGTVAWSGAYTTVGQYGVDTTAGTVWVVTDSNSQFVVVPEPDGVAVAALAALAAAGLARRRRTA
jgi:fibronectin-binding autotransporter adhesin